VRSKACSSDSILNLMSFMSVDRTFIYNLVKPNCCNIFISMYFYQSLHVSAHYVSIIRRNNCVFATLGTCYSVRVNFWYAGWNIIRKIVHQFGFIYKIVFVVYIEGAFVGVVNEQRNYIILDKLTAYPNFVENSSR
jgi:hypothetical protein